MQTFQSKKLIIPFILGSIGIVDAVGKIFGEADQHDDMTMAVVKVR